MSITEIFFAYARAFEETFNDDDWSRLERFFTADSVYLPGDGTEVRGRQSLLDHIRTSLDTFDRRFDSRFVELTSEPVVTSSHVTIQWKGTYRKDGLPEVVLSGTEVATFEGNAISRLEDSLDDGVRTALQSWTAQYGHRLEDLGSAEREKHP